MLALLAGVNASLAIFDCWLTRRRILDYGVNIELNSFIRHLVNKSNTEVGVTVGVMLPVFLLTALFGWLNWPIAFAIMIGMRLKSFIGQVQSLQFESQVKEIKKRLDDMGSESKDESTLHSGAHAPLTPPFSEDKDAN
jgi:hypothetical protein